VIARAHSGSDWGPSFWWFAARYYLMPWFAWGWLRYRRDGEESPFWFRISQLGFSALRLALVVFLWFAFSVSLDINLAVPLILGGAAVLATVTGVMRAQYAYSRYGGGR
jgi:hypothetical protein